REYAGVNLQMSATGRAAEKPPPPSLEERATKAQRHGADGAGMHRRISGKEVAHDSFILNGWQHLRCRRFRGWFSDVFKTGSTTKMGSGEPCRHGIAGRTSRSHSHCFRNQQAIPLVTISCCMEEKHHGWISDGRYSGVERNLPTAQDKDGQSG